MLTLMGSCRTARRFMGAEMCSRYRRLYQYEIDGSKHTVLLAPWQIRALALPRE